MNLILLAFIASQTAIVNYLRPIDISESQSGIKSVDCIYLINLDERPEKLGRVKPFIESYNLSINRVSGINGWKLTPEARAEMAGTYENGLPPGHIGCILSHVSILQDAYARGFDIIWVLEDDAEFLEDPHQLTAMLEELTTIDPEWDIFYTDVDFRKENGGYLRYLANAPRPTQAVPHLMHFLKRQPITDNIMSVRGRYGTHSLLISSRGIKKMLDYFTHVYLWTSIDVDIHYIPGIRQYSTTKDIVSNFRKTISDTSGNSNLRREE